MYQNTNTCKEQSLSEGWPRQGDEDHAGTHPCPSVFHDVDNDAFHYRLILVGGIAAMSAPMATMVRRSPTGMFDPVGV